MMRELELDQVRIADPFWSPRLEMNATKAILHQWEQLERTGCIGNLRLAAAFGRKQGFREGWFFADSDAYKWLDAACRIYTSHPSPELKGRIDGFVDLIAQAQTEEGYLYTYNQIHFPGRRWLNLQIEHELYCHGHLIEAGISHFKATGERRMLDVAERAAELLVRDLRDGGPELTDGHEEIELALIKLYRVTRKEEYLDLAERFLERRGRIPHFWWLILRQNESVSQRRRQVKEQRDAFLAEHPDAACAVRLPPGNAAGRTRGGRLRSRLNALSGKMLQQHRPIRQVTVPVGHAVRFAYLETAIAMLYRQRDDPTLLTALEQAWDRMVRRRMYVTGGIGSVPEIEGFGRDYELDPELAYDETCAALGCLFWNWEMALATRQARYADLFEWQLYNAASVGMGQEGTSYLYNNPLRCRGGISRQGWFEVPCCPSNLSRTWAALGKYLFSTEGQDLWVHQYVGCEAEVPALGCLGPALGSLGPALGSPRDPERAQRITVESELPWRGRVLIRVVPAAPAEMTMHVRIPSWTRAYQVWVNGQAIEPLPLPDSRIHPITTASGYSPYGAFYFPIRRTWNPGDEVKLDLPMPIVARRASHRVRGAGGLVALTRGPLVYCLESVGEPRLDLFSVRIALSTLRAEMSRDSSDGAWLIHGQTTAGQEFAAIPYFSWGNQGESQMTVPVLAEA